MKIILGITGSVSAYKAPWLIRDLRRNGHDVRVIMTPNARAFVAPLALESTSTNPVIIDPYAPSIQDGGSWHVHMAHWADVMIIAPCSASTLAKMASGQCDNALLTVAFSLRQQTPLLVFPAMDTDMWEKPATLRNVQQLRADGVSVVEPASGELASGLIGKGRLPELEDIVAIVNSHQAGNGSGNGQARTDDVALSTLRFVVTAGPTHEPLDAVRSIVNHSSGKMGFAMAEAARDRGMMVTLIAGPTLLPTPAGVERLDVTTASDMHRIVMEHADADVVVMAAAVADFTPANTTTTKIKKHDHPSGMTIELVPTTDILAALGARKQPRQTIVGFALEYENVVDYAEQKLIKKNVDMIVANRAGVADSGFGGSNNTVTIVTSGAPPASYPAMSKRACAEVIIDHILEMRKA